MGLDDDDPDCERSGIRGRSRNSVDSKSIDAQDNSKQTQKQDVDPPADEDGEDALKHASEDISRLDINHLDSVRSVAQSDSPANKHTFLSRVIHHSAFKYGISLAIVVNAVQMGAAVERQEPEYMTLWLVSDHLFTSIYALEMAVRVYVLRVDYFRDAWNVMDFIIAWVAIFDTWILHFVLVGNSSIFRILKLIRFMRYVRVMKVLKVKRELQFVVEAFAGCLKSMFWVLFVLFVVIYIGSFFLFFCCVSFLYYNNKQRAKKLKKR